MLTSILLSMGLPILFGIYIYMLNSTSKKLPPGPLCLPIIGTAYNSDTNYTKNRFASMRKKYGDVFIVHGGKFSLVVLNAFDDIKQAANRNECSERGIGLLTYAESVRNTLGLASSDFTAAYNRNRKWHMTIMREMGMRTPVMDQIVMKECEVIVQHFKSFNGAPFYPSRFMHLFAINAVMAMLLNRRFEIDDPDSIAIAQHTGFLTESAFPVLEYEGCPLLMQFSSRHRSALHKFIDSQVWLQHYMMKHIKDRIEGHAYNETCFLGKWLERCRESKVEVDKEPLSVIMGELLNGGADPVAAALQWLVMHLANNPKAQARAQNEINAVLGLNDDHVTWERRDKLPYVQALIMESQRMSNPAQIGLIHFTHKATNIGSYHIPAKTFILFNYGAVLMSETTFEDPHMFRPERFLDHAGAFVPHPHLIPFGTGKRSCAGEILAKQELFLFTVTMLQNFVFQPLEGMKQAEVDIEPAGFVHYPKGLKIVAECR